MATIQGVYVALFGRPADPAGLTYFNTVTKNGADLGAIGNLAGQKEYADRFTGLNNAQIINTIYQSLFGRDADASGLEFFAGELNAGKLTINNIAIAILDGAKNDDKKIVDNKVAAADLFTKSLDTNVEVASYTGTAAADAARAFLKGVSTTAIKQDAVDTAVKGLVSAGAAGNTVVLTKDADEVSLAKGLGTPAVTLTDRNDTIDGSFTKVGTPAATWNPVADKIDAGLGVDTLNARVAGLTAATGKVAENALNGVEVLNLTATGTGSQVDVENAKQLTQVWNVASTLKDDNGDIPTANLTVNNIALTTTVGIKGNIAGATAEFGFAENSGSSDAAALALDGAKNTATVTIAGIETLNVSNLNTSNIAGLFIEAAKTVNVTGSGELTLATAGAQVVETFNASAYTGKLTVNLGAENALKTATGGTGVDKFTVDTVHTNDITINGGAGSDTLSVARGFGDATKAIVLTGGADADIFSINNVVTPARAADTTATPPVTAAPASVATIGNVAKTDTAANFIKTLVTISDFDKSADAIKFAWSANGRDTLLGGELSEIASSANVLEAAKTAAGYTDAGKYSVFTYGGDAYILGQDTTGGLNAGDALVKVTGVTDVASFTATNFVA